MKFLDTILKDLPEYRALSLAVGRGGGVAAATGLSGVHKAHVVSALVVEHGRRALLIAADEGEAQRLCNDLLSMGRRALVYPARDFNFRDTEGQSREYEHQRLHVLASILNGDCDVAVACADAALQYTIPPEALRERTVLMRAGQEVPVARLTAALAASGYERCEQVEGAGQYAVRGGIVDFFTPDATAPVRVEYWGDEIDTISWFDVESQRRTDPVEEVTLAPSTEVLLSDPEGLAAKIEHIAAALRGKTAAAAREVLGREAEMLRTGRRPGSMDKFIGLIYGEPATLLSYFGPQDLVFWSEPVKLRERLRTALWQWGEDLKDYLNDGVLCRGLDTYAGDYAQLQAACSRHPTVFLDTFARGSYDQPLNTLINFTARQLSVWSGSLQLLEEDLRGLLTAEHRVAVLGGTERAAKAVAEELKEKGFAAEYYEELETLPRGRVAVLPGGLSAGLEYPGAHFSLITHGHIAAAPAKRRHRPKNGQEIYSLAELTPGDYVVHSAHGIGVFEGIHKLDMHGVVKDYIKVRYAKGDTLYVPVTQLDMVSKYIGPREEAQVRLHRLGGSEWQKAKARVRTAVKDIAKELIALYAARMNTEGYAFAPDGEWQRDFEARFEYEETEDQLRCVEEIKADMERKAPMDRLLCGDVGFGKTEVALRAAFKCVTDGKQCALLVPTTILAWQHYQTVMRRFEGFPIRVELLSRFRSSKEQTEILKKLKRGEIDMIIGTHRLVQKDVLFHNLGLCIIDEEQRFGVAQKERFKELTKNVDVLTLSATPIPRTLNMAMSGIRDMSVLEEAPQDRHPVQTYVLEHDQGVINDAIRRELRRGGQVYYLHNKVESIERVAASLQNQIPEAKVGFGHGKMAEGELSEIWRKVMEQEINVLVCTTIIETGVDVPNVNTIIIENADHMGLSQLHQIRGRVGRSSRRAYAYLTFTRSKVLSEIAQKRLAAIREFTEFGSGFKIAMRDLELRGAGNILGGEQHGHMETVGYDMYLRLLGEAVSEEKGEKAAPYELECLVDVQVEAHIPERYVQSLSQRLDIYRRISDIRTEEDASDVLDEMIDRFGEPPQSVKGLIDVALVRNTAASLGIYEIKQQNDALLLFQHKLDHALVSGLVGAMRGRVMVNAGAKPYISVKLAKGGAPLEALQEVLRQAKNVHEKQNER
jgi:transcription-repair coupling factor (superfamily II helicase)